MEANTYTPLDEFIADITASNYFKDNPHLVDEASIARWVFLELKRFGRAVMGQYEEVVHVSNYRANLPENFSSLNLAIYCDVDFVSYPAGTDPIRVQSRLIGERITTPEVTLCEECLPIEDTTQCSERIVENFYMDATKVSVAYKNFQYVTLGKDLIRSSCASDCANRGIKDSPYSINIKGTTLYSTFKEGTVYMRYYGLPMSEECLPVIPKTQNGFLEQYLEYNVKRRILEDAMMSGDTTNKQFMFQFYLKKEEELLNSAKSDVSNLDMLSLFRAIGRNRKRMNKYNIRLGAIRSNYVESGLHNTRFNTVGQWNANNF